MKVYANLQDILSWLQHNVGPLKYTSPTSEWFGQGWHIQARDEFNPVDNFVTQYCNVNIYDTQKALIFALKWT
jgi:hypothetical protein